MRLRRFVCLLLAFLFLLMTGCQGLSVQPPMETSTDVIKETSDEPTVEPSTEMKETEEKQVYSILFIGNSYTYYNDMPIVIFKKLAASAGVEVKVNTITKGAHKLSEFADPKDEYGAKVEKALSGTKKYDFVILQEQSVLPASEKASEFYGAVRNLAERIRATGATPVLYSTWGRKTGSSTLSDNGWTNESMTWKLAAAYQAIGEELEIPVVYVGLAFYHVQTMQGGVELYHSDKSHPSYEGSFLAAASLFAGIFEVDPTTATYTGTLTSDKAEILREAARKVVFETPAIPEDYVTTSKEIA